MNDLVAEYKITKELLAFYKKKEHKLRLELTSTLFPTAGEGSFSKTVDGIKVKASFKNNISIDKDALATYHSMLSEKEIDCIRFTPGIVKARYKELSANERTLLDDCLIIKPALPTVTLIEEEEQ